MELIQEGLDWELPLGRALPKIVLTHPVFENMLVFYSHSDC